MYNLFCSNIRLIILMFTCPYTFWPTSLYSFLVRFFKQKAEKDKKPKEVEEEEESDEDVSDSEFDQYLGNIIISVIISLSE